MLHTHEHKAKSLKPNQTTALIIKLESEQQLGRGCRSAQDHSEEHCSRFYTIVRRKVLTQIGPNKLGGQQHP